MLKSKSQQGVWKMVAPDMKLDHEVLPPRPRLATSSPPHHLLTSEKGGGCGGYTLHATSSTLHPAPCTLHPKPDPEATRSSTLRSTP